MDFIHVYRTAFLDLEEYDFVQLFVVIATSSTYKLKN